MVTMMGAVGGGISIITVSIITKSKRKYFLDIQQFVCGILGGLVSITSSAGVIEPWEAWITGFIGGLIANGGKDSFWNIHFEFRLAIFVVIF